MKVARQAHKSYKVFSQMDKFEIRSGEKRFSFVLMGIGLLTLIIGIILAFSGHDHWAERIWSNILVNNMFLLGISLAGLFLIAVNYIGLGGWYVAIKRVAEAVSMFIPYAGVLMLVILIGMWTNQHHIYHWAEPGVADHDALLKGKSAFLNVPFFSIRIIIYFAIWTVLALLLRKASLKEDELGGMANYNKSKIYSAIFLVLFGITSSTMSWDFMMSIDPHWYSTLYGWYTFTTLFVSGLAAIILITIYLKSRGYLEHVNNEHLHDLGKFMFAFSIFWAYLWYSQHMLIWYANLGEETTYFKTRVDEYPVLFYLNFAINFVVPFFALMTRNSKRQKSMLGAIALILLLGHWLDYYQMIIPGSTHNSVHYGLFEIGLSIGYVGLFIFVVFNALTKAKLTPQNHPLYKESIHYHT
jgi:Ni/Fe-hydrogenase subunit HybB-like protein